MFCRSGPSGLYYKNFLIVSEAYTLNVPLALSLARASVINYDHT